MLESSALEQLHDDERLPVGFIDVVDGANVGMIQSRSGSSLTLETFQGCAVGNVIFGDELERHSTAQADILGFVNDTHTTAAKFLEDAVVRNGPAGHAAHPCMWL